MAVGVVSDDQEYNQTEINRIARVKFEQRTPEGRWDSIEAAYCDELYESQLQAEADGSSPYSDWARAFDAIATYPNMRWICPNTTHIDLAEAGSFYTDYLRATVQGCD